MARDIHFLCLARSFEHGGLCLAGMELETGRWVRPISSRSDGALREAYCTSADGSEIGPLSLAELRLDRSRPAPHQPEDWVIGSQAFGSTRSVGVEDALALVEPLVESGSTLLGDERTFIDRREIPANGVQSSLALVKVRSPVLWLKYGRYDALESRRVIFELGRARYNLPVTSTQPELEQWFDAGHTELEGEWLVVVSLGEPWLDDHCYKLAVALLGLPPAPQVIDTWQPERPDARETGGDPWPGS